MITEMSSKPVVNSRTRVRWTHTFGVLKQTHISFFLIENSRMHIEKCMDEWMFQKKKKDEWMFDKKKWMNV